jgi:hypothetical protein
MRTSNLVSCISISDREDGNNVQQRPNQRRPLSTTRQTQISRPDVLEEEYDDELPSRMPASARRYRSDVRLDTEQPRADVHTLSHERYSYGRNRKSNVPQRTTARTSANAQIPANRRRQDSMAVPIDTEDMPPVRGYDSYAREPGGRRMHWLFYIGLAMFIMMIGWFALTTMLNWWRTTQDDLHYGRPRTFQTDAVVGHNDSSLNPSHFIAINLHRHIQIVECPANDCSKAKVYIGPVLIGQGQDLAVVTLSFADVNGDGKPDMIVSVQDSRFVFINDSGAFRSQRPGENVQLAPSS